MYIVLFAQSIPPILEYPAQSINSILEYPAQSIPSILEYPAQSIPSILKYPAQSIPSRNRFPLSRNILHYSSLGKTRLHLQQWIFLNNKIASAILSMRSTCKNNSPQTKHLSDFNTFRIRVLFNNF